MYSGGHCFIVDGCWNLTVRTTETVYDTYFTPWAIVSTKKSTTQRCYMHIITIKIGRTQIDEKDNEPAVIKYDREEYFSTYDIHCAS